MDPDMINCMILSIHVEKFLATPSSGELVKEQSMADKTKNHMSISLQEL